MSKQPDPRTAALAEALHKARCAPSVPWPAGHMERHIEDAAAILAALPADWCGHPVQVAKWREMGAEIARLRRIEEAARVVANRGQEYEDTLVRWGDLAEALDALRAALEEDR